MQCSDVVKKRKIVNIFLSKPTVPNLFTDRFVQDQTQIYQRDIENKYSIDTTER